MSVWRTLTTVLRTATTLLEATCATVMRATLWTLMTCIHAMVRTDVFMLRSLTFTCVFSLLHETVTNVLAIIHSTFCTDNDECSDGTHTCAANATCINTDGGYNCSCDSGYEGNGFNCTSKMNIYYVLK